MTISPIKKQLVLDGIANYANCSDFLRDMMYDYHEKIIGISLKNIYKIFEEKHNFEMQFFKKNKEWPSGEQTYEFITNLIQKNKYYKL